VRYKNPRVAAIEAGQNTRPTSLQRRSPERLNASQTLEFKIGSRPLRCSPAVMSANAT